ncbi:WecB/TagA/CpsF family glycosyltransferase [Microbacterium sp. NPDC076895]|uniref:WecB/TagA/CpsF family glycosyltransferase n=1 Tax=Microbacterium sp. NPDC076895 TaxID=3154957 RepID=UPI003426D711
MSMRRRALLRPAKRGLPRPIVTTTVAFRIDAHTELDIIELLLTRGAPLAAGAPKLIVTPNMNHLAILQRSEELGEAYRRADLHLPDGWPVVRLAQLLGVEIIARTTGSGIVERLAKSPGEGRRILVIGGSTLASSERAAARLAEAGWSVRSHEASAEWLAREGSIAELATLADEFQPDIVLVGLGAIKQEVLALALMRESTAPAVYLGVGAAIDFLAGEVARAPVWLQRLHLEFFHRILVRPGPMIRRYVGDVVPYFAVVRQSLRAARAGDAGERVGRSGGGGSLREDAEHEVAAPSPGGAGDGVGAVV